MLTLSRRQKIGLAIVGVGLVVCLYFIGTTEVVQTCENHADTAQTAQAAKKGVTHSLVFISRHCWGVFFGEDDRPLVALGTLGLLGVTALLAFYTLRLWGATQTLAREAKEDSEETIKQMRVSEERELRAYVGLTSGEFVEQINGQYPVSFKLTPVITNWGQTPAYVVSAAVKISVTDWLGADFDYSLTNPKHPIGVLGPGQSHPLAVWAMEHYPPEIMDRISGKGGKWLFIYGRIEYRDAFKVDRTTDFCYWINRGGISALPVIWTLHAWHNEAT